MHLRVCTDLNLAKIKSQIKFCHGDCRFKSSRKDSYLLLQALFCFCFYLRKGGERKVELTHLVLGGRCCCFSLKWH